ncbi:hypothetical protein BCV72DRAFT_88619 [Rhizopus microsporus var. microsporus]|uniref:Uncharacterized protein n=2 Tax=Rhizopus microsporus TaxID=58291 RepID=A0A2G4SQM9_RHIZD|nr:uncharacterized protein RHIMIDRAFT_29550 [Rhizopus microsporus ATCC 52813]ORE08427.1 hypothetical protein BCV72DRAFT_88619 [Rhizopus microsporus var. microsporus]PHZ11088.1 hypothetical protein RHIMIDRAFT_29550 [Rhizopus microsporus ATCC 52813]
MNIFFYQLTAVKLMERKGMEKLIFSLSSLLLLSFGSTKIYSYYVFLIFCISKPTPKLSALFGNRIMRGCYPIPLQEVLLCTCNIY